MAFDVPDYGAEFVERVTQRVDCLISLKLWDIQRDRYEAWKNQFHSETERFFAACVLDSLIYRSKDQFNAANDSLYRGALVETLRPILQPRSDFALVDALRRAARDKIERGCEMVSAIRRARDQEEEPRCQDV